MTEVPEHLLRRSQERRAALGGEAPAAESGAAPSASSGGPPAAAGEGGGGAVEAAAAAPAPARAAAPAPPAYTGPPQAPPRKLRVPMWAMPVVVALPFWAFLYAGAFGERADDHEGPLAVGRSAYAACATCHGGAGEGGVGPALDQVVETFPNFDDHVAWVTEGSSAVAGQPYGALGRVATGSMPGFGSSLTPAQIIGVVCHERVTIAHESPVPPQCEAAADGAEGEPNAEDSGGGKSAG